VVGLQAGCARHNGAEIVPVQILAINDFHGQLSPGKKVNKRPVGSAPVLAAYLKNEQQEFAGFTFIVHAGDLVGASPPVSALLQDEPAIMFMNLLGNQECSPQDRLNPKANLVGTVGNHAFDEGLNEMIRLLQGGNHAKGPFLDDPWQGAAFPHVVANVVKKDTYEPILPPYVIKKVNGVPIAFIGAVVAETKDLVLPSGVADLEFLNEAEAINSYIPVLQANQVKSIIVLIHHGGTQQAYEGRTRRGETLNGDGINNILARLDDEVDVVVSGHTHSFTNGLVPNQNGKKILVTQAQSAGKVYADIELEISRKTRDVEKKSAAIVAAWADAGPGLTPDPEAKKLTVAAEQRVAPLINRKISKAATDIVKNQNSTGESALGNLIADAQRKAMATDFAFTNPGGIRTNIAAGEVTWGDLYAVQPFNNYLVKMELTGQQIHDLLNRQFPPTQTSRRILQISGLTYTWDANLPDGHRIVGVRQDGMPIDKAKTYTVTVNNFLAQGGDRFSIFKKGKNKKEGPNDLAALISYIKGLSQPFSASIDGRIKRLN
jgi:5'-nucleotidase